MKKAIYIASAVVLVAERENLKQQIVEAQSKGDTVTAAQLADKLVSTKFGRK